MIKRCDWATSHKLETDYHDTEWGIPVHDDQKLFEMLILESAQSGLSWLTILKKREGYRDAFDQFNFKKIALYTSEYIETLLQNPEIIRNKLKINATVHNARLTLEVITEFGSLDQYLWSFVDGKTINNQWQNASEVPSTSTVSDTMSKTLKKRGFKFIGPTTCYSFMQSSGMVNDHLTTCFRHNEV